MAKRKGQQPKTFPQVTDPKQTWTDSSVPESPHRVTVDRRTTDTDKQECWECTDSYFNDAGQPIITTRTLYLPDFAEPWMQVDEPEKPSETPVPLERLFQIIPGKKGSIIICPKDRCDQHPMEDALPWEEYQAEVAAFIARHADHARDGRLPGM